MSPTFPMTAGPGETSVCRKTGVQARRLHLPARPLEAIFKVNQARTQHSHHLTSPPAGRPAWVDLHLANRLKIPHTFVVHTYTKPTKCHFCNKLLVGVFKQGLQCKDCNYNVHKKCSDLVPRDCTGDIRLELEVLSCQSNLSCN